ncbi:hypothetical protein LSCM1_00831 [Leishmania martiniquensis]|uniref:Uncharacterized protein n=1 Tax=Leishmania martiniquensis TaxID=1580590 RepID=A0A836FPJ0_9TRYP|nr:hypothetical protein LSCM1_00831 [Leishmania martiniquensis]
MSYAQRHRSRAELHQHELVQTPLRVSAASAAVQEGHTPVRLQDMAIGMQHQHQQPPLGDSGPGRSSSLWRRWNGSCEPGLDAHEGPTVCYLKPHSVTGANAIPWSETTSSVGSADVPRQPFHLLQHTPNRAAPPRLKASHKQFASPSSIATTPGAAAGQLPAQPSPSPRGGERAVDERRRTSPPCQPDLLQGTPATGLCRSQAHQASNESPPDNMFFAPSAPVFGASCATSSSRLCTSPSPASEAFAARLRNIIETRKQIELLVQKQRQDEEEMTQAIESLGEQSPCRSPQQPDGVVDRLLYEQALGERAAAFAALRKLKERGNHIVHKLYATAMAQQEQALELLATVEALRKANKRLKNALSSEGGVAGDGLGSGSAATWTGGSAAPAPSTVSELQEKVAMQRRVIDQMDQLMQNADRMLLAMRARVEAAERRASGAMVERQQPPPLPLTPGSATPNSGSPRCALVGGGGSAMVASPDVEAAIERLTARYTNDDDVAAVSAQLQRLLDRVAQLREALKREQAQRLHLEEVYGATYEETARNVALLERRLQRVECSRGVVYNSSSSGSGTNASPIPMERRILVAERSRGSDPAVADGSHHGNKEPCTLSQTSSRSSSSTPAITLFTAASVEDASTRAALADTAGQTALGGFRTVPNGKAGNERHGPKSRQSSEPAAAQSARWPRPYLGDCRGTDGSANDDAAAEAHTPLLGIPVPDVCSLGASARHSLNSRSSSASRRLVGFRPAKATDVTSRCLGSGSDKDDDEVHVAVGE